MTRSNLVPLPLLVLALVAACGPEGDGCPDPNDPVTHASILAAILTPPCPDPGFIVGWAEVGGIYRRADGSPIAGQRVTIHCPPTRTYEPPAPFAEAYVRTRLDGSFRTLLALRLPGNAPDPLSIPAAARTQHCVIASGPYAEVRDSVFFAPLVTDAERVDVTLVWGEKP